MDGMLMFAFVFFFWAKFCQNVKINKFKGIFCHRFLEILKKITKKVEVLS
jgi:hypothetical protein